MGVESTAAASVELPGWGAWGGQGVRPSKGQQIRQSRKRKEREEQTQQMRKKRKDAELEHVIISEKATNLPRKYMSAEVPFPFRSIEQYEKTLETPLGKDWNTVDMHQNRLVLGREGWWAPKMSPLIVFV